MFKVNLVSQSGFRARQQQMLANALKKFEVLMNSSELKSRIVNFKSPAPLNNSFADNMGLNNQQVFEKLFAGEESYTTDQDYEADLHLVLVKKRKPLLTRFPAIGYGLPGQKEIYTYTWWFNQAGENDYAAHVAHEWAHKVGFDHSFQPTPMRQYSVPYSLGDIILELSKTIL